MRKQFKTFNVHFFVEEVPDFCKANPTAVIHSVTNCAEFYNCSDGNKAHECPYPDLFSKISHKCENFTGVDCDNRTEPQAPCKYTIVFKFNKTIGR